MTAKKSAKKGKHEHHEDPAAAAEPAAVGSVEQAAEPDGTGNTDPAPEGEPVHEEVIPSEPPVAVDQDKAVISGIGTTENPDAPAPYVAPTDAAIEKLPVGSTITIDAKGASRVYGVKLGGMHPRWGYGVSIEAAVHDLYNPSQLPNS